MGKSALIDLLSSLSLEQVRELRPAGASDEFCQWVVDSVHVSIDFNGFQTIDNSELVDLKRMIAIRLLHRCAHSSELCMRHCVLILYLFWLIPNCVW
jgi:hypothetical protein